MKKLLLIGLAALGVVALSGCDMIQNLISGEKEYNYADFKALLADRKLSFDATKCTSEIDVDGEKETREYTYDADDDTWRYSYKEAGIDWNGTRALDLVGQIQSLEFSVALLNKKVDDLCKFYATSDSYRYTATYESKSTKAEAEYKFGKDGLMTYSYEKNTDLDAIKSTITKETFSYSK